MNTVGGDTEYTDRYTHTQKGIPPANPPLGTDELDLCRKGAGEMTLALNGGVNSHIYFVAAMSVHGNFQNYSESKYILVQVHIFHYN